MGSQIAPRSRAVQTVASIVLNEQLTDDTWRMTLAAPDIAARAKPGQFVALKIGHGSDLLVRRPFSVVRAVQLDSGVSAIEIVYRVVGRGTGVMTGLRPGDEVDVIGPLGHGFEPFSDKRNHVLLGGGCGVAGLLMLGEELSRVSAERGQRVYAVLGAQTGKDLLLEKEYSALDAKVMVATDDGSAGYHGNAVQLMKDAVERGEIASDCAVYACGPEPMLRALSTFCRDHAMPAQVLIEKRMLCCIGACLVCVCRVDPAGARKYRVLNDTHMQFNEEDDYGHALVCKDGPVFNIEEVVFDE